MLLTGVAAGGAAECTAEAVVEATTSSEAAGEDLTAVDF